MSAPHILVVDDEPDIRELVREILEEEGYQVSVAEDAEAARRARRAQRPDLILLDVWMPDADGITLLKEWSGGEWSEGIGEGMGGPACPVIVMSGHGTVETAVEATRLGAYDFLEKPLSMAKLLLTVERALEAARLRRENVALRRHVRPLEEPLGRSPAMQALREQLQRVAQHDAWVLITGEPGSGKELCARYLHGRSARREGPFVEVGVAALVGENAAVELFGAEEAGGRIRYGLLEQARGGTLFLDEVGDMDLAVQARLFGALESGSFLRVGGTEPVPLDVRIVAATHRDLAAEVRARRFREDLYYKLNVVPLQVPPLRERGEDVPQLLAYYVDDFVAREGLGYRRFTVAAQNFLRHYPWPGNVRELKNLVQRLLILGSGPEIDVEEVRAVLGARQLGTQQLGAGAAPAPSPAGQPAPPWGEAVFELPLREARERFERAYLEHHLRRAGGSVGRAAKAVGLERTHLYRKLKALGLEPRELAGRGGG